MKAYRVGLSYFVGGDNKNIIWNEERPESYIYVPRITLTFYLLVSAACIFIFQVLCIKVLLAMTFAAAVLTLIVFLRRVYPLWKSCGYSKRILALIYVMIAAAEFFPAWILRTRILDFITAPSV